MTELSCKGELSKHSDTGESVSHHLCINRNQTSTNRNMAHTRIHLFELLFELSWSQSVLIQPIIPVDLIQDLQVTPDQPVPTFHHHLGQRQR